MQEISPELVSERLQHQLVELIDVRTPMEYHELHVEGARNIPLDSLDFNRLLATRKGEDTDPIYFICRSGMRATKACEKLIDQGFEKVCMIHGGVLAWEAAGLPLVRGKKAVSLERQVRIAAGIFILLGVLLGSTLNLAFFGLSAFVGVGLIVAGITDSCAMGMLLAKMPWNRTVLRGSS